ncbi:MAG: 5-formyltetrahydrofolate cyclo-ligase [Leptospiraceae bacterium]|nr:MAG: 5-formyltetrahydrofolate cyclo-ligase [Leptospiraceae bacterium]
MKKQELRKYAKENWEKFLKNKEQVLKLLENLKAFLNKNSRDQIFAFYPINFEPPILDILDPLFSTIYLPVIDFKNKQMKFAPYKFKNQYLNYKINSFNILEPELTHIAIPKKEDIIIIPSLGVNSHFVRLGRGAGYYDKFFSDNKNSLLSIKISLLPEVLTKLEFIEEKHDLILDILITENNIVYKTS